jgi:short-subunit dehydrogenase
MHMTNHTKGTALITGASSGIGATFARQLAAQGYDLILVARRVERLQSLADELRHCYSVRAEAIAADLSAEADLQQVEQRVADQDNLTMLVNNAGFGTVGAFVHVPLERHVDMIAVHVIAPTRLCYAALPGMIRRKQGAIINVSSVAAFMPASVDYSSTKAYLNVFSEALQMELKGTGVYVQALCPGLTHTEFHDSPEFKSPASRIGKAPKFAWMSAEDVVATSLRSLGHGSVICIPGWGNRLMATIARSAFAPLVIGAMSGETLESKQSETVAVHR